MRRTTMRTLGTAAVLVAVVTVSSCGSGTSSRPGTDECAGRGKPVAKADLDGDGSLEAVRLGAPGPGPCAHRLLAGGGASVDVSGLDLVAKTARVVHLRGADAPDLLLLASKPHPRGGSQMHLFGEGGAGGLTEVSVDGDPVVPFVATDGGAAPMTITCTDDGGIAVLTGTAHQPPGVVLAWDVRQTAYDVRDGEAVDPRTTTVERAAADPLLRKEMPELFAGRPFADCS